jgi:hypothetical protein
MKERGSEKETASHGLKLVSQCCFFNLMEEGTWKSDYNLHLP